MVRSSLLARLVLGLAVGLFPVTASLAIAAPPQSAATQTPVLAEEDFLTTARVLSQSLQVIHDRTIKSRSFQQLAVAGLRGLSTIDSDLAIDIERSVIRVTLRNRSVLGVPLPEVDASWAWAGMLVATVRELRDQSPALAAAPLEALHTALISGALEGLDAHTRYDPPGEAEKHRSRRNGFSGIGVRYVREGEAIRIREVMAAGPSDGLLRADDLVTHVDGQPLAGMEMADMSHYLRGPRRSKVALTIRRGAGTVRDVTIVRDRVVPQSVTAEVRNGVAVLHIHRFNIATVQSVREAVEGAQTKTGDLLGVVLDLRGNPGGLLNQAHGVADLFIDEGVLVTTRRAASPQPAILPGIGWRHTQGTANGCLGGRSFRLIR